LVDVKRTRRESRQTHRGGGRGGPIPGSP
jgi:hypothetical protein